MKKKNYWNGGLPQEGDTVKMMKNGKSPLHMVNSLGTVSLEDGNIVVTIQGHRECVSAQDLSLVERAKSEA